MFITLLKQPLLHFLLLGALIFAAYAATDQPEASGEGVAGEIIVVDRTALLNFMQYQARAFEPDVFAARLDAMTEEERQALVAEFVREEALYREALALGMDAGDYIIRQRLVQKVEFLLENLAVTHINPDDAELETFYLARAEDYEVPPVYTFAHVFFDARQGGNEQALSRARDLLAQEAVPGFDEAAQYGDRYPFLQEYVERTRDFVVNNFSADFVSELDKLEPDATAWQGPLASRYGYHLVLLQARTGAYTPAFAEIRERVLDDYRYEALLRAREEAEQRVVAEYVVEQAL